MEPAKRLTIDSFVEIAPNFVKKIKKAYPTNHKSIRFERVSANPAQRIEREFDFANPARGSSFLRGVSYDPLWAEYKVVIGGFNIGRAHYTYGRFREPQSLEFHSKKVDYKRTKF